MLFRALVPTVAAMTATICCPSVLNSFETPFVGPRGTGMGGANTSSAADGTAQFYNPAILAFQYGDEEYAVEEAGVRATTLHHLNRTSSGFGWDMFDVSIGASMSGDVTEIVDELDTLDLNALDSDISTVEAAENLTTALGLLNTLTAGDSFIAANANAGTTFRWRGSTGGWALGARMWGDIAGIASEIDLTTLAVGSLTNSVLDEMDGAVNDAIADPNNGFSGAGYRGVLTDDQRTEMQTELSTLGYTADRGAYVDYLITQESGGNQQVANGLYDLFLNLARNSDDGSTTVADIQDASVVVLSGISIAEIPLSYSFRATDWLSFGVTAKALFGRVNALEVRVNDTDIDPFEDQLTKNTTTFGIDAAAFATWSMFSVGLTARNINGPTFDGVSYTSEITGETRSTGDYTLDPQVTLGGSIMPFEMILVSVDIDLLQTSTLLREIDRQYVRAGVEVPLWVLDFRGGLSKNLGYDDSATVGHFGLGIDLAKFYIDFAAAMSLDGDTATYDGTEIPQDLRVAFGLGFGF